MLGMALPLTRCPETATMPKQTPKKQMEKLIDAGVGSTVTMVVQDRQVEEVITPPVKLTVNPKAKSASMSDAELLKVGRLCMLQGSKKLAENAKQALCDLLCSGLESGIYGSTTIIEYVEPDAMKGRTVKDEELEPKLAFRTDKSQVFRHLDWPMNKGGALKMFDKYEYHDIRDDFSHLSADAADVELRKRLYTYTLDYNALVIGLARLSLDHPHVYAQWLDGGGDALTGDALVQCALFGDIVYG